MIDEEKVLGLLRLKGKTLFHREGQELEFKEQFNLAGLADYFRDFSAFANNRGGYLIFGVKYAPRIPQGLSNSSASQFEKIDPEKITGYLLEIFSSEIRWEQATFVVDGKTFGVFKIYEAETKPIIAKKDEGKDQIIKNGEIYYRYGGRTQKIQFAELESIIQKRIERNNNQWIELMQKIGRAGPQNAAVLDTEKGLIEKGESQVLVLDEELTGKIKFIREGEFVEKKGATALKLVGDVMPVDQVEVVKHVKENLTKMYPFSAMELCAEVRKRVPKSAPKDVWNAISDNEMKSNTDYSAYNFRNKKQEDDYREHGTVPATTPSIYNHNAVELLVKILSNKVG